MLNANPYKLVCFLCGFLTLTTSDANAILGGHRDTQLENYSVFVLSSKGSCTGVVISRHYILTAAFCVDGQGDIKITAKFNNDYIAPLSASSIFIHPEYVAKAEALRKRSIPLAIIKTSNPLPGFLKPIKISRDSEVYEKDFLQIGGYGVAAEGNLATSGSFRSTILQQSFPFGISKILYWLVPLKGEAGACSGDAGGPVVYKNDLVGLIMWAEGDKSINRKCGTLTQAIKISVAIEWINEILQK